MSCIGSTELLVIALITAFVIGPENIRPVMKKTAAFIKTLRKVMKEVKIEADRYTGASEIRQELQKLEKESGIKEFQQTVREMELHNELSPGKSRPVRIKEE